MLRTFPQEYPLRIVNFNHDIMSCSKLLTRVSRNSHFKKLSCDASLFNLQGTNFGIFEDPVLFSELFEPFGSSVTAHLFYHTRSCLSSTFFDFFQIFLKPDFRSIQKLTHIRSRGAPLSRCLIRIPHPSRFVNTFFHFFGNNFT